MRGVPAQARGGRVEVDIDGRTVSLSNLDKIIWPRLGLTKAWLVDYYMRIAASCCRTSGVIR